MRSALRHLVGEALQIGDEGSSKVEQRATTATTAIAAGHQRSLSSHNATKIADPSRAREEGCHRARQIPEPGRDRAWLTGTQNRIRSSACAPRPLPCSILFSATSVSSRSLNSRCCAALILATIERRSCSSAHPSPAIRSASACGISCSSFALNASKSGATSSIRAFVLLELEHLRRQVRERCGRARAWPVAKSARSGRCCASSYSTRARASLKDPWRTRCFRLSCCSSMRADRSTEGVALGPQPFGVPRELRQAARRAGCWSQRAAPGSDAWRRLP